MRLWKDNGATKVLAIMLGACLIVLFGVLILWFFPRSKISYPPINTIATTSEVAAVIDAVPVFVVTHVKTPVNLKAVYMTSWAAGNQKFRKELFDLVDTTEINSVVIDVKDYSGRISFLVDDPELKKIGASEKRILDIKEFIGKLHEKKVYVIARISKLVPLQHRAI